MLWPCSPRATRAPSTCGWALGRRHEGQNSGVPLSRISWIVTVVICLVASLLLLLNGYQGYSGVLLAVGAAAAVNLR